MTKGTVLITGVSGFVAAHVVEQFLAAGYSVRGTVRTSESAAQIRKTEWAIKYSGRLSIGIIPDITVPGAFDDVVKGVEGVIHTQSPFYLTFTDNEEEMLKPAIQGTVGLLKSIHAYNKNVRRVVITSSFAAIYDHSLGTGRNYTYSEADWNPVTYEEAAAMENKAEVYCASKKLAELAAWEFVEAEKPTFSLTTICPPGIYGPSIHYIESLSKANLSTEIFYNFINGALAGEPVPKTAYPAIVDVRDVGLAHLRGYERDIAGGQRYFTTAGNYSFENVSEIIAEEFPQFADVVPKPKVSGEEAVQRYFKVDGTKAREQLGIDFIPLKQIVIDTVNNLIELEKKLRN